ncbi:MAG: pallilysin-related adhesin [Treponema sp.]|jgi:outer membrane protein OmpA-like peptidoglycan-associated protein|nr:pallilysin-related adhesin [Treponema sp.]
MNRQFSRVFTSIIFIITGLGVGALMLFPHRFTSPQKRKDQRQTQLIIPQVVSLGSPGSGIPEEHRSYEAYIQTKVALEEGEVLVSLLTEDFDGFPGEEQIIAYRKLKEKKGKSEENDGESPIYITYVAFDEDTQGYKRLWSAPTAATRPGTLSLYTKDLIGDRSVCVILVGMNSLGEQTLTIFKKQSQGQAPFSKLGELQINGTISIREVNRSQAYQNGIARGQSFSIVAYGHDSASPNGLDQTELTYIYNPVTDRYEQSALIIIPGSQIEQRRLREVVSGGSKSFEAFIDGLWYYVSPQGTLDNRQYIYFDPQNRELIFFGEETQQVFTWQNSSATRYGLYIASQNISVSTLRRFLDIELESLDSIRVRVSENVRLKIGVNTSWDGSYRKAGILEKSDPVASLSIPSTIDAVYTGSRGKFQFFPNGVYELSAQGSSRRGLYAFVLIGEETLLELRPGYTLKGAQTTATRQSRETYLVEYTPKPETGKAQGNLTLFPVRFGTKGIQKLHETAIFLMEYEPLEEQSPVLVEETPPIEAEPVPVLSFSSTPPYFSPDNDGVDDELFISLNVNATVPIASWSFQIREPQPPYQVFYQIEGNGSPPERITWNGKSNEGELVQAATDYPFTFKAADSRGNEGSMNGTIGVDVLIIRENEELRIQVPSIIFRAGYADFQELSPDIMANNVRVLRRIAEILNKFRDYKVRVEGHANRTQVDASYEEQQELRPLSESRARAVVNQLVEFGVTRNRLTAVGMGSTKPVVQFEDRDNWWKNRRVEFILIK